MSTEYYIGLMSGTSMDGLDGIVIAVEHERPRVLATGQAAWPDDCAAELHALCAPGSDELERMGRISLSIARHEARLTGILLEQAGLTAADITAIGAHGQTVRHCPQSGYSVQLGSGPLLAALSGIDTVFDFRAADLAAGGQGAPLTPVFHQLVLACPGTCRMVLNLGGIANLTILSAEGDITAGYDCGPANTLMDLACRELFNLPYDRGGELAARGRVDAALLAQLFERYHDFLSRPPPKSTGRELFSRSSIAGELDRCRSGSCSGHDLLATLTAFTAQACARDICSCIERMRPQRCEVVLCGGGAHNPCLSSQLRQMLEAHSCPVISSTELGVDADYLEAEAFAYFAYLFCHGRPCDLRAITGAAESSIMGCLAPARDGFHARSQQQRQPRAQRVRQE